MNNIIVAQSGGPTAAINASLVGVIRGAKNSNRYDNIYGALHGISGVMNEDFIDLTQLGEGELNKLYYTPACYLGSCRYKMPSLDEGTEVFEKVFTDDIEPESYVEENGLRTVNDEGALTKTIEEIVAANPKSVEDYKSGKEKAIGFLVGQTMKAMKGKADPGEVNRILKEILSK